MERIGQSECGKKLCGKKLCAHQQKQLELVIGGPQGFEVLGFTGWGFGLPGIDDRWDAGVSIKGELEGRSPGARARELKGHWQ